MIIFLFSVGEVCTIKGELCIVRCCHADPTSGHLGEKKTYNRIIERFTWNRVMKDVKQVVSDVFSLL